MKNEGFATEISADKQAISITGQFADAKGRILSKTKEMVERTLKLNEYYQSQVQFLKNQKNFEMLDGKQ